MSLVVASLSYYSAHVCVDPTVVVVRITLDFCGKVRGNEAVEEVHGVD